MIYTYMNSKQKEAFWKTQSRYFWIVQSFPTPVQYGNFIITNINIAIKSINIMR